MSRGNVTEQKFPQLCNETYKLLEFVYDFGVEFLLDVLVSGQVEDSVCQSRCGGVKSGNQK